MYGTASQEILLLEYFHACTANAEMFLLGTNFRGQASPQKLKRAEICTRKELSTVIMVGDSYPRKLVPSKM